MNFVLKHWPFGKAGLKAVTLSRAQWCMPVIPATQEDDKFEASLSDLVSPCHKILRGKKKKKAGDVAQ